MEMFLKKAINWCSNLTLIFQILKLSITVNQKKSLNYFGNMALYTPQFKHKNNKKSFIYLCRKVLDAVCTHVTSSAASHDSAVKLMPDSYQFWVAH